VEHAAKGDTPQGESYSALVQGVVALRHAKGRARLNQAIHAAKVRSRADAAALVGRPLAMRVLSELVAEGVIRPCALEAYGAVQLTAAQPEEPTL
jgi:hypothetical protein